MSSPTFDTSMGEQISYYCSSCKQEVPEHINDRCPHCGIRFDYVEQPDGSRKYNGRLWGGGIGGIIAVVIGVVVRLVIMAQRNS
jgi:DNA-directed RNA polymerase subunit RPC12/RpoP